MGNVVRILLRDFKRLIKAPAAMVVVCALLVLPSLYTWYNVVAFWNPYDATGNISVCVVNQDAGTSNEMTGQLNVGSKLVEEMQGNKQLGWVTDKDYDEAMEDLKVGKVYAVYVVPEDFSECLVSPLTGEIKRPHVEYYANEKLGPVSPKVTDTAASALEQTINSTFVATVSEVATQALDDAMKEAKADIADAETKASSRADEARAAVAQASEALSGLSGTIDDARSKVLAANEAITAAYTLSDDTWVLLQDVTDAADVLQASLANISADSIPKLSNVLAELSQITAKAVPLADAMVSAAGEAQSDVAMVLAKIQPIIEAMRNTASDLEAAAAEVSSAELSNRLDEAAQDMTSRADEVQAALDGIQALADQAGAVSQEAVQAASALNGATAQASDSLVQYATDLHGSAILSMDSVTTQISDMCAWLTGSLSSFDAAVEQIQTVLGRLDGILGNCKVAVSQTNALIGNVQADIDSTMADARMLAQSSVIANLLENGTLNAQNISEFMGSPTELSTTQLYHLNVYGTAMAPLFMNLTFWIGAFMLVIIFLLEVDSEGIKGLKPWQRYLGRFLMFCIFAAIQAIICCAGTLALGVQAANVGALFVAACVASLAFLSVIYALSATFRHVGKALCIVLVFAQIPGGSGLYPVEMTSSFFQSLYPLLPFTYGIDAMREAIGGFYGNYFVQDMAALGVFFFGSLGLGLLLGPLMTNVVRMTARQIQEGDLYNGADSMIPERPYRLTHMMRALAEKDDYRAELEASYARFSRRYPIFVRASIVLGIGVPVIIGFLLALDTAEKTMLLTVLLFWLIALIGFVVIVESRRYSLERQLNLKNISDDRLLRLFSNRDHMTRANARSKTRARNAGRNGAAAENGNRGEGANPQGDGSQSEGDEGRPSGYRNMNDVMYAKRGSTGGVRNVWLIARRDFSGLFKNVMSVVITVGLVVLPSLFALYNILACWDVFNNTGNLSVAVATKDEGYSSDLLPLDVNLGEKVESALRANDLINWVFTNPDDAVEGVKAGRYYAALVIPESFSKDMLTFYEGDSHSATIDYYVNEKKNAIAPNITGLGADAVSHEVNAAFANTITEVAIGTAKSLSEIAEEGDMDGRVASLTARMRSMSERLENAADVLNLYTYLGRDSQGLVEGSAEIVASASERLQAAKADIDEGKKRLQGLCDRLSESAGGLGTSLDKAYSAVADIEQKSDSLIANVEDKALDIASQLREKAADLDAKAASISEALETLEALRDALKSGTNVNMDIGIDDGVANTTIELGDGTIYQSDKALSEDIDALSSAISALEEAKASLEEALVSALVEDRPRLQARIDEISATKDRLAETRETLRELLKSRVDVDVDVSAELSAETEVMVKHTIVLDKDIAALQKALSILQEASSAYTNAADNLEAGAADVEERSASLHTLVENAKADAAAVKADLSSNLDPSIAQLKSDITALANDFEYGIGELRALDPDLAGTLTAAADALGSTSTKVNDAAAKLNTAAGKMRTLADAVDEAMNSGDVEKIRSLLQGGAGDLAAALTEPVQVERTALFPSENFGSAMTPLYCTLALFIGSLLIMVAMKPEVSRRGREELVNPKPRHLYFGRFIVVAAVSLMQTTLLGLGCMLFLKVHVVHPLLFMCGFWFSGLVLAFMIYTLVVAFGNLGKAIAVLLLIVQVTACGGSYPLQMLPDFVQIVSPWVPATYIVDILQAAMMGVYHNDFWVSMGLLALFIIPFLLLGLLLRKPMERFMKFYVSKVEECGIMG